MSPIDDELRSALHTRAGSVTSSPDFFTGIERRATRMRRQKVAASIAGSALAVSALGLGGPLVASSLQEDRQDSAPMASAPPTSVEQAPADLALDPDDPWAYRGDAGVRAALEGTAAREWATRNQVFGDYDFVPLFGQAYEPSATDELVFLAVDRTTGEERWGVVQAGEAGPEFVVDVPLETGATALPAALAGDEVARLLVVASPEVGDIQYGPDSASEWTGMTAVADGVAVAPLEGDPADDRLRVLAENGDVVYEGLAPDPATAPEDEGPGTETPVEVDGAEYALDLDDPWAYRGPAELTQHPDLGVEDERLFTGTSGEGWSSRPLYALERADGLSVLLVLRERGGEAVVSTTWQEQDEAARQSVQPVRDGQLVVQTFLPQTDGTGVLIALASPRTGAVEVDVRGAQQSVDEQGVGAWTMPLETSPGELFLYSEGDGLLYHSEPARRS